MGERQSQSTMLLQMICFFFLISAFVGLFYYRLRILLYKYLCYAMMQSFVYSLFKGSFLAASPSRCSPGVTQQTGFSELAGSNIMFPQSLTCCEGAGWTRKGCLPLSSSPSFCPHETFSHWPLQSPMGLLWCGEVGWTWKPQELEEHGTAVMGMVTSSKQAFVFVPLFL